MVNYQSSLEKICYYWKFLDTAPDDFEQSIGDNYYYLCIVAISTNMVNIIQSDCLTLNTHDNFRKDCPHDCLLEEVKRFMSATSIFCSNIYTSWVAHHMKVPRASSAPSHYLNQCWLNWTFRIGINFSELRIKAQNLSKIHLKMSYAKWRPFCRGGGGGGS